MRHLREQDGADPRWAGHGKTSGCRLYPNTSRVGALCKCPLWRPVVELTRDILKNEPRPVDDEDEEPDEQDSQTESEEMLQIISSTAKKSKGSSQKSASSILKKRQQKQAEKRSKQQVRFSKQLVLVDSNNKAHHQQLQASAGSLHMSFGKDRGRG